MFTISNHDLLNRVTLVLDEYCNDYKMINISVNKEGASRYEFRISLKSTKTKDQMIEVIRRIEGVAQLRISTNEVLAS